MNTGGLRWQDSAAKNGHTRHSAGLLSCQRMKYRTIKSVAHNFADSFASTLNYVDEDYVLSYLARRARDTGKDQLVVDLITGVASPVELACAPVADAINRRVEWFPKLLQQEGVERGAVRHALMTVRMDIAHCSEPKPYYNYRTAELPIVVAVRITDNRGIEHAGKVEKLWPFAFDGPELAGGRRTFARVWSRLKKLFARCAR